MKIHRAAGSGGTVVVLAGRRLRRRDQLLDRLRGKRRIHQEQHRNPQDQTHGREILQRVVGHLVVHCRVRPVGHVHHHHGVAVRRGPREQRGRYHAARARPVVGNDLLPQAFAQPRRQHARSGVGSRAGRVRDQHPDRAGRVRLGLGQRKIGCKPCNDEKYRERAGAKIHGVHTVVTGRGKLTPRTARGATPAMMNAE